MSRLLKMSEHVFVDVASAVDVVARQTHPVFTWGVAGLTSGRSVNALLGEGHYL